MPTPSGSPSCSPRYATPRRSERNTLGGVAGKIATTLGTPYMPWQQDVADVALEINPRTGRLAYDDVRVTVPRQSGKTTLLLPIVLTRWQASAWLGGPQNMLYFAQNRIKARKKWLKSFVNSLNRCDSIENRYSVHLTTGDEYVEFDDGSSFGIDSTTESAVHGDSLDWAAQDEAFALPDFRMDQAVIPTMATRPSPQFWIVSTAGKDDSVYLWNKVETGRDEVMAGSVGKTCYVEYSAPEDTDPDDYTDRRVWYSCMPALGYTIDEEAVQSAYDKMKSNVSEFARAYLNIWPDEVINSKIPLGWWRACADPGSAIAGQPAFAVDVSWDRSTACIVAVGTSVIDENRVAVEVVDYRPGMGTRWVVPRLVQLVHTHRGRGVALDAYGPVTSLVRPLVEAGITPEVPGTSKMTGACGALYDAAFHRLLTIRSDDDHPKGDPVLEKALKVSATRKLVDSWVWHREGSKGDISPIVAVTVGLWAHGEMPERAYDLSETFG